MRRSGHVGGRLGAGWGLTSSKAIRVCEDVDEIKATRGARGGAGAQSTPTVRTAWKCQRGTKNSRPPELLESV